MENMENAARKKVMLSGIQPSGDLTLGSYLGAIKNWAERDEDKITVSDVLSVRSLREMHRLPSFLSYK